MEHLRIHYYNREKNFGDTANYDLCKKLSGREPLWVDWSSAVKSPVYLVMGSILDHPNFPTEVWGSGLLSDDLQLQCRPEKVHAVRGPLSRVWLLKRGVECPEVYGDPGILFPLVYPRSSGVSYDLGIVPHYADYSSKLFRGLPLNVLVIDVQQDPAQVIMDITSCRNIVSSSLHGLIAADAYGIPSMWVEFSDKVLGKGFKFLDYFNAAGGPGGNPRVYMDLRSATELNTDQLISGCGLHPVDHLVEPLLKACPFRCEDVPVAGG